MSHPNAVPVGGPVMTRNTRPLLWIALIALALVVWRFAVGLGAATGLNDGYPWGIWIAFDVVTGTALACGGYAVALLAYIFNKGRYHPLVRPAILTSALGYSVAAVSIIVDVGRPWLMWKIPVMPQHWNLNSALLEVALCVMAYVAVLWIELSPAVLEKWQAEGRGGRADFARRTLPGLEKALPFIIALGLLLPTMHQSSLGTVILLAGHRLHGLWNTGWNPFLFLVSCIAMGYAVVVMEATLSARAFGLKREDGLLKRLAPLMAGILLLYVVVRLADLAVKGRVGLMTGSGLLSGLFWLEILLFTAPALMLLFGSRRIGALFRAAFLIVLAGALYRFDAYLAAYSPSPGWSYFPTVPETVITLGLVAFEVLLYVALVKTLPILGGAAIAGAQRRKG